MPLSETGIKKGGLGESRLRRVITYLLIIPDLFVYYILTVGNVKIINMSDTEMYHDTFIIFFFESLLNSVFFGRFSFRIPFS